jgi:hypothetical protein
VPLSRLFSEMPNRATSSRATRLRSGVICLIMIRGTPRLACLFGTRLVPGGLRAGGRTPMPPAGAGSERTVQSRTVVVTKYSVVRDRSPRELPCGVSHFLPAGEAIGSQGSLN